MLDLSGDTPTVATLRLVFPGANEKPNAALDQVAGLLVRMGMARQDSPFAQPKLGHQRFLAAASPGMIWLDGAGMGAVEPVAAGQGSA